NKMHLVPRLFIGGYRELRRPENPVDQALMERLAEARQRLRLEWRYVKPLPVLLTFSAEPGTRESPRPQHICSTAPNPRGPGSCRDTHCTIWDARISFSCASRPAP